MYTLEDKYAASMHVSHDVQLIFDQYSMRNLYDMWFAVFIH